MIETRCPICDRPMRGERSEWPNLPFCSDRCRLIDLGRWLGEKYCIPDADSSVPPDDADDEDGAPGLLSPTGP